MKRKKVIILIALICFAYVNVVQAVEVVNNNLANLPDETLVSLGECAGEYMRVDCELPDGQKTTIWANTSIERPTCMFINGIADETFSGKPRLKSQPVYFKQASYPADAIKKNIDGKVEATCIVEKDGTLSDIKIIGTHFPSIMQEATRLLTTARLMPCKIDGRIFRCRYKIAMMFALYKYGKTKLGNVLLVNADNIREGVLKRFSIGMSKTETVTYSYSNLSRQSGYWEIHLDIDIPDGNPDLEQKLCKLLYDKNGNSLETEGEKYAKKNNGEIKDEDFKSKKTRSSLYDKNSVVIKAFCIGYKRDKYYSYGYEKTLVELNYWNKTRGHNFIYDIQSKRMLTVSDLLTADAMGKLGINPEGMKDLALNEYCLFIADGDNKTSVYLSQENWQMFTPTLQALIGEKNCLPQRLQERDFVFKDTIGYAPEHMQQKVRKLPEPDISGGTIAAYIRSKLTLPDSLLMNGQQHVAKVSYLIEPDSSMSYMDVVQDKGDKRYGEQLRSIIAGVNRWTPLILSYDGVVRSLNGFKSNWSAKQKINDNKVPAKKTIFSNKYFVENNKVHQVIINLMYKNGCPELEKVCSEFLFDDSFSATLQEASRLFASEKQEYNKRIVTPDVVHTIKMEIVEDIPNCTSYFLNIAVKNAMDNKLQSQKQWNLAYDTKHNRLLTIDDVLLPDAAERVKKLADTRDIHLLISNESMAWGYLLNGNLKVHELIYTDKSYLFLDSFKKLVGKPFLTPIISR